MSQKIPIKCEGCKKEIGVHSKSESDRCADVTEIYSRVLRALSK